MMPNSPNIQPEIIDVDPLIIAHVREVLSPRPSFSYAKGDHLKQAELDEKRMREKTLDGLTKTDID